MKNKQKEVLQKEIYSFRPQEKNRKAISEGLERIKDETNSPSLNNTIELILLDAVNKTTPDGQDIYRTGYVNNTKNHKTK